MKKFYSIILPGILCLMPFNAGAQLSKNPNKFLGNITTYFSVDAGGGVPAYYTLWNQITPENESKWISVEGTRGRYNWGSDTPFNYAKNHGFIYKFHALVWGSQYPNWFTSSLPVSERYSAIVKWFDAVKAHYPDLPMIDVVNEAVGMHQPGNPLMKESLGGGGRTGYDWLIKAFELAHERWPNAILIYNDFNTFQYDTDAYIDLVRTLRDAGAPIDAYGCQSHDVDNISKSDLQNTMSKIQNALKMPMYITELDINIENDDDQKTQYQNIFPLMWEADYCAGVTIYGYVYGATWVDHSGLYKDGVERPAMTWLREYMTTDTAKNAKSPFPGGKKQISLYIKPSTTKATRGDTLDITVRATMVDPEKTVDSVKFYVNGLLDTIMTEAPFIAQYVPATNGRYDLKAIAYSDGQAYVREGGFTAYNPRTPFKTTKLPGIIQAEDFDKGGDGLTYHDSNNNKEGDASSYRTDCEGVDIINGNGGFAIGYTSTDEWLEYTVNVTEAGAYTYTAYVSSGTTGSSFSLSLNDNDNLTDLTGTISVPQTGDNDWSTYTTVTGRLKATLNEGKQVIRLNITGSSFNIDKIALNRFDFNENIKLNISSEPVVVNGSTTIKVDANDDEVSIANVKLYLDTTLLMTFTQAPYEYEFKPSKIGNYTFHAVATFVDGSQSDIFSYILRVSCVEIDGICYNLNDTKRTAEITSRNDGYSRSIIIPSKISYNDVVYSITNIGDKAFYNCSGLSSISIPKSVTSIGSGAFEGCENLDTVSINSNTIVSQTHTGDKNFSSIFGNQVKMYVLGDSVTSIGRNTFRNCSALKYVYIPGSITSIGDYAFYNCNALTTVIIPESVMSIGDCVFYDCDGLTSINIPNSVKSIGINICTSCEKLDTVFINSNMIISKTYSSSTSISSIFGNQVRMYVLGDSILSIGDYAFNNCKSLISISIPESVMSIGNCAFYGCSGITSVTIPESVTSIGPSTFSGCSELTSITIPESVTSIGNSAFYGCNGITSVTIPESVTSIGPSAFSNCLLDTVFINSNTIASQTYSSSNNICSVFGDIAKVYVFGDSVKSIGDFFFYYYDGLITVIIPENVTSIGNYAFYGCSNLYSATIPENVMNIGNDAFYGCSSLSSVTIPKRVTSIGHYLFYNCKRLTSISIPKGVTSIGNYAFSGCSGLSSIIIPDSVTSIGNCAFSNCIGLTSVIIPESVTNIGDCAFSGCSSLDTVYINSNTIVSEIYSSSNNFSSIYGTQVKKYVLGDNITSIGGYAFYGCRALTDITIPKGVTSIESNTFNGCTNLTTISIPESVTTIGDYAFSNCSRLSTVTVPNSVTSIEDYAFSGCKFKSLIIGSGLLSIGSNAFDSKPIKTFWLANTPPSGYEQAIGTVNYAANNQYSSISNIKIYQFLSSMFEVDGIKYVPVSPSERTCDVIDCCYDSTTVNVNINKTVLYRNISMTVNNVQSYSCYGNKYIQDLRANNESDIMDYAFCACTSLKNVIITNKGNIGYGAFRGCSDLDEVIIANEGNIDTDAFYNCYSLKKANVSNQGYIGQTAFYGCTNLEDLTIDIEGELRSYAFQNCSSLKEIELLINGDVGPLAFSGCTSLRKVDFGDKVGSIREYAFSNCSSLANLATPDSAFVIEKYAFNGCSSLDTIVIKNGITSIGDNAFDGCTSLTTLIINDEDTDKLLLLGSKGSSPLFADCPLDSVYIGRNIGYNTESDFGYSPFYRNTTLRSIVIADGETEISENEFYGCSNLKNVIIGDGVTKIGARAFSGCASLEKFSFGEEVAVIGEEAFSDCTALTEIKSFAVVPPTCGNQALDDINKWNCVLSVPENSISDYQVANQWKDFFFIIKNEDYVDAVFQVSERRIDVVIENGIITVSGLSDGEWVSVYQMNGHLIATKNATNGISLIPIANLPIGTQVIISIGKENRKFVIM